MITLKQLDRLSLAALEPAYLDALRAGLEGGNDSEAWRRFRRTFARSLVLSDLIGRAFLISSLKQQGVKLTIANPAIEPGEFAHYAEDIVTGPFWQAINLFRAKIPNLRGVVERLSLHAKARAFWVADVESKQAIIRVRDYIAKGLEGKHADKAFVKPSGKVTMVATGSRQDFVDAFNTDEATLHLTRNRLQTVYRTNIMGALNEGQFAQIQAPGVQSEVALLMLNEVHDNRTRGNPSGLYPDASPHYQMDRFVAAPHDTVWNIIRPPNGYNSFLPDTVMSGRFEKASKANYSGVVIKIKTRAGRCITVTANHPVLTNWGFVPASFIKKGQQLACDRAEIKGLVSRSGDGFISDPLVIDGAIDNEHIPTRIEDVFEAFSAKGVGSILPNRTALDFHGDSRFMYGDVHIVTPDCLLPDYIEPFVFQETYNSLLMQYAGTAILSPHTQSVHRGREFVSFGAASRFYAPIPKIQPNRATIDTQLLRELEFRYPGEVFFDDVISVESRTYSGHVYDLQSPNGWIVADGILVSNCRATISPLTWERAEEMGLADADNKRLFLQRIQAYNGKRLEYIASGEYPDIGFRGPKSLGIAA